MLWFASSLAQAGGGERLLLEGVENLERMNIEVTIVTLRLDEVTFFNGRYKPARIRQLFIGRKPLGDHKGFALFRYFIEVIVALRKAIDALTPDVILVQSEDNAVLVWLATWFKSRPYVVFMFGQMFQFPSDLTKYARPFRRHLAEIRKSRTGYQQTIPLTAPPMSPPKRVAVQVLAWARYAAIRKAVQVFSLSRQVQWETEKLYRRDSVVLKGAFPQRIFEYRPPSDVRNALGLPPGRLVLTISRLTAKKNVPLCIRAFKEIAAKYTDTTLIIGGTGPDAAELKRLAASLDLESRVRFVGFIDEQRLWDYYATCDVFVQLDVADFNIVVYEAAALGKKLVLSTDQELDDVLVSAPFIFAAEPDVPSVAEALQSALHAPPHHRAPEEKAKLADYAWENYFSNVVDRLEKCHGIS